MAYLGMTYLIMANVVMAHMSTAYLVMERLGELRCESDNRHTHGNVDGLNAAQPTVRSGPVPSRFVPSCPVRFGPVPSDPIRSGPARPTTLPSTRFAMGPSNGPICDGPTQRVHLRLAHPTGPFAMGPSNGSIYEPRTAPFLHHTPMDPP